MTSPVKIWRNQKKIVSNIGKIGKIVSFTVINISPDGFCDQAPYPVALIKLDNGEKLTAQVVDYKLNDIKIGRKVVTVLRRLRKSKDDEVIPYGIKVKPI
jgi:uncharacterized protein